jgi:hypothetical protein
LEVKSIMHNDEYGVLLDLYERIEHRYNSVYKKQKDLTVKLDKKIEELETHDINILKSNQSLPLSIT